MRKDRMVLNEETFGHCRDVNQCSIVNGTCLTGCNSGFKGDLRKTGKYAIIEMHAEIALHHDFFVKESNLIMQLKTSERMYVFADYMYITYVDICFLLVNSTLLRL